MARPRSFDRDAALDEAMRAFWADGYEQTSIADLTKAMGIAAPSLYAAFGDKDRLFAEAVERYQAGAGQPVHTALATPGPARDAIAAMLDAAVREYARRDVPRGCFILSEPRLGDIRERSHAALRDRIAADGATEADADGLAAFYGAILNGMSARARDGADADELRAIADRALAAWPAA